MNQHSTIDMGYSWIPADLAEYTAELAQVQETCARYLATFSPRLRRAGESWLRSYAGRWQSVEWTLPLALGAAWSVPQPHRKTIAVANVLTAMQAHVQQRAMINPSRCSSVLLPLSSLLYTHVVRLYQQFFPLASDFWPLLEGYHLEWAEAVLWERQRQRGPVERYSREDILHLAGSRAPLKIGSVAVAVLGGRQQKLMQLGGVLDQTHVAIQLIDGVANWREDLRAQQGTYFLTEAALALNVQEIAALSRASLVEFLATSSLSREVVRQALDHLSTGKKLAGYLNAPALVSCLEVLRRGCEEIPHLLEHDLTNGRAAGTCAAVSLAT